ncbi:hypothetical protein LWI28_023790 [Acer negundo]|uniref:Uncharacterized protein n=1 Tax=Acer negundo TaxID=4023 RepID=A0AAD5NM66_ACENE|nr:hypothetical protein LWI28_023790 [Acer negundo]
MKKSTSLPTKLHDRRPVFTVTALEVIEESVDRINVSGKLVRKELRLAVMEQLQVTGTLEMSVEVEPQLQQVAYEGGATPMWPAERNSAIPVQYQREIYPR